MVIGTTIIISYGGIEGINNELYKRTKSKNLNGSDDYLNMIYAMGDYNIKIIIPKIISNRYWSVFANIEGDFASEKPEYYPVENTLNIKGANLKNCDLRSAMGNNCFLVNSNIRFGDLRGARFNGADMRSAKMEMAKLQGAEINWADFSGAHMEACELSGCQSRYAKFNGAIFYSEEYSNFSALFWKSEMQNAEFRNANLTKADFKEAILCKADFSFADLSEAEFNKADLRGANFEYAKLNKTDFRNTDLSNVINLSWEQLRTASLDKTKIPDEAIENAFDEIKITIKNDKKLKTVDRHKIIKTIYYIKGQFFVAKERRNFSNIENGFKVIDKTIVNSNYADLWDRMKEFLIKIFYCSTN